MRSVSMRTGTESWCEGGSFLPGGNHWRPGAAPLGATLGSEAAWQVLLCPLCSLLPPASPSPICVPVASQFLCRSPAGAQFCPPPIWQHSSLSGLNR